MADAASAAVAAVAAAAAAASGGGQAPQKHRREDESGAAGGGEQYEEIREQVSFSDTLLLTKLDPSRMLVDGDLGGRRMHIDTVCFTFWGAMRIPNDYIVF